MVENVSLDLLSEEIQLRLSAQLGAQVKVYSAYQKQLCYITFFSKTAEEAVLKRIESGDVQLDSG